MTVDLGDPAQALKKAVDLLSRRSFGSEELKGRLMEKGFTQEAADEAVERLFELNLLDDLAYAESVLDSLSRRGYGSYRIRHELEKRKLTEEIITSLLGEYSPNGDVMEKYIASKLKGEKPERDQAQKVLQGLVRRGFSWSEAREAMSRYLGETIGEENLWE